MSMTLLSDATLLLPMAGRGQRFLDAGYTVPKPLIEVEGKPMIQAAIRCLGFDPARIVVVANMGLARKPGGHSAFDFLKQYEATFLPLATQGAADSTLSVQDKCPYGAPLLIANTDQIIRWDPRAFVQRLESHQADGGILTFNSTNPQHSYARVVGEYVTEVAEKQVISEHATVGIYWWRRAADYFRFAIQMMRSDKRVNGEFYIAPVYNEAVAAGQKIITHPVQEMWSIGTPDDLQKYLSRKDPPG